MDGFGVYHRWVEWRARRIADPRERLLFLRQAMAAPRQLRAPRRKGKLAALGVAGVAAILLPIYQPMSTAARTRVDRIVPAPTVDVGPGAAIEKIWLVEQHPGYEVYSNGLRIETAAAVANRPRAGHAWQVDGWKEARVSGPVGIVFHTTESHMAPFDASHNQHLKKVGKWLVEYVRQNRSYHYVIDRFGRVHRVVREEDAAFHAGYSVWADGKRAYLELNESFLAVAVESQSQPGEDSSIATTAQVHALRTLTAMLRSKYQIEAANCVTHAQVSVNPGNFRIGAHTDWAASFPYQEVGLPDNYRQTVPAIHWFGFGADDSFRAATGPRVIQAVEMSEEHLRQAATANGVQAPAYRAVLRKKYRDLVATLPQHGVSSERNQNSTESAAGTGEIVPQGVQ